MRIAVGFFCLVLIILPGVLTHLGAKSSYVTEARFWKAKALSQKVVVNPDSTPSLLFEKARKRFEGILRDYPQNQALVRESNFSIAGLLIYEKKYQEARNFLDKVRKEVPDDRAFGARSQFLYGFSYEREGDWEAAVKEYRSLRDRYKESLLGLEIPLYIARHELRADSAKGAESYDSAAAYYRRLIEENPKSPLKFFAMSFLLGGYEEQKKWDKSLAVLQEIVMTYPKSLRIHMRRIETTSRRLKQPEKAAAFYETFVQAYPDHKDASLLKKRIRALKSR